MFKHQKSWLFFFNVFSTFCVNSTESWIENSNCQFFFHSYLNEDGFRRFCWTASRQGWLKSSFFWGYVLLQIHGGTLAEKFGTRKVLGIALFLTSILTLLTPLIALLNVYVLIAIRVLMGVAEAVTFPSLPPLIQR